MRALIFSAAAVLGGCVGMIDAPPIVRDAGPAVVDDGMPSLSQVAAKYPDFGTVSSLSIARSCGPNNGVCHNSRQFPDMQTASGVLSSIGQRCNQIRDQPETIDNLCEPAGDVLRVNGQGFHVGKVTRQPQTSPTSLVVTLDAPIADGLHPTAVSIERQVGSMAPLSLTVPAAAVIATGQSTVTFSYAALAGVPGPGPAASGSTLAAFFDPPAFTPGDETQVQLGDPNGDGVFGASLAGAVIKPGDPMKSYLFLRILGPLEVGPGHLATSVKGEAGSEAQMPIANQQYWDLKNDVVALWCWIQGMAPDGRNADGPIDYGHCDTHELPLPTVESGIATTFSSVYERILKPKCATCHYAGTSQGTTLYMDDLQQTYDVLLGIRGSGPSETASGGAAAPQSAGMPYVSRAAPSQSYLYLKVLGDPAIGDTVRMPVGGQLPAGDLDAIATWIAQGAYNN